MACRPRRGNTCMGRAASVARLHSEMHGVAFEMLAMVAIVLQK
jgi:hypothetical protein